MRSGQQRGVYRKFDVRRIDGSSELGGKHADCCYFVLDLAHDEFAIPALRAYAKACKRKYPTLASDLRAICAAKPMGGEFAPENPNGAMAIKLAWSDRAVVGGKK